jgi:hypothetical protein
MNGKGWMGGAWKKKGGIERRSKRKRRDERVNNKSVNITMPHVTTSNLISH